MTEGATWELDEAARVPEAVERDGAGVSTVPSRIFGKLRSVVRPASRTYYLYVLPADGDAGFLPAEMEGMLEHFGRDYTFGVLPPDHEAITEYVRYRRRPRTTPEDVVRRLDRGEVCIVARLRGEIVGDTWLALDSYPLPAPCPRLEKAGRARGYAYGYMSYVVPHSRGLAVYPLLIREQARQARARGKRGLLGSVLPGSTASWKSAERVGFQRVGTLHAIDFLSRTFTRLRLDRPLP